jgi:hypothetical protein
MSYPSRARAFSTLPLFEPGEAPPSRAKARPKSGPAHKASLIHRAVWRIVAASIDSGGKLTYGAVIGICDDLCVNKAQRLLLVKELVKRGYLVRVTTMVVQMKAMERVLA